MEKIRLIETNIDRELLSEIMRNLEKLESSTELEGSAIVSKTGLRIASSETADVVASETKAVNDEVVKPGVVEKSGKKRM